MDPVELWREEVQSQLTKIEGHLKDQSEQLRLQNGNILRHNEEIFGSEEHNTAGLKPDVRELKILVIQAKTVFRIVIGVVALVGFTNILLLIRSTGAGS